MQLGIHVKIIPGESSMELSLLYTDAQGESPVNSSPLATFTVPYKVGSFIRANWKVTENSVVLYTGCQSNEEKIVSKFPQQITFDKGSILYIGQAGPLINNSFEVSGQYCICFYLFSTTTGTCFHMSIHSRHRYSANCEVASN